MLPECVVAWKGLLEDNTEVCKHDCIQRCGSTSWQQSDKQRSERGGIRQKGGGNSSVEEEGRGRGKDESFRVNITFELAPVVTSGTEQSHTKRHRTMHTIPVSQHVLFGSKLP